MQTQAGPCVKPHQRRAPLCSETNPAGSPPPGQHGGIFRSHQRSAILITLPWALCKAPFLRVSAAAALNSLPLTSFFSSKIHARNPLGATDRRKRERDHRAGWRCERPHDIGTGCNALRRPRRSEMPPPSRDSCLPKRAHTASGNTLGLVAIAVCGFTNVQNTTRWQCVGARRR